MVSDFSPFALWLAGLATVAQAYTTPVGANPSGNPISKPGLNEIVPVGAPYAITWSPTTSDCSSVDLVLLRGPSTNIVPLYAIVENIPNTGSYSWTPAASLEPDTTHYGIQLICDQSGAYQYTTQFGISNPGWTGTSSSASSASASTSASSETGSTSTRSVYLASSSSSAAITSSSLASSTTLQITSSSMASYVSSGFPVPGNSTMPHASGTISKPLSSKAPSTRTTIMTQTNTPTQTESGQTTAAQTTGAAPTGTNGASVARAAVGLMGVAAAVVFAL